MPFGIQSARCFLKYPFKRSWSSEVIAMAAAKRWVHKVKTVSTFPPEGTFTKDAKTIAKIMGSKKVSPKGPGSGIRMIQFFINRAGKDLSPTRRRELERAKRLLRTRAGNAPKHHRRTRARARRPAAAKKRSHR